MFKTSLGSIVSPNVKQTTQMSRILCVTGRTAGKAGINAVAWGPGGCEARPHQGPARPVLEPARSLRKAVTAFLPSGPQEAFLSCFCVYEVEALGGSMGSPPALMVQEGGGG